MLPQGREYQQPDLPQEKEDLLWLNPRILLMSFHHHLLLHLVPFLILILPLLMQSFLVCSCHPLLHLPHHPVLLLPLLPICTKIWQEPQRASILMNFMVWIFLHTQLAQQQMMMTRMIQTRPPLAVSLAGCPPFWPLSLQWFSVVSLISGIFCL